MLRDHRNRVFHDFRNEACRNLVCTGMLTVNTPMEYLVLMVFFAVTKDFNSVNHFFSFLSLMLLLLGLGFVTKDFNSTKCFLKCLCVSLGIDLSTCISARRGKAAHIEIFQGPTKVRPALVVVVAGLLFCTSLIADDLKQSYLTVCRCFVSWLGFS